MKWVKIFFFCYCSDDVSLCGGRIYSLHVDAVVMLAPYVFY